MTAAGPAWRCSPSTLGQRDSMGSSQGGYNPILSPPVRRSPVTPEELARQAKQHLDSLRAAGVEWVPDAPPPVFAYAPGAPDPAPVSLPVIPGPRTLFGADEPAGAAAALTVEQRKEALAALARRVA